MCIDMATITKFLFIISIINLLFLSLGPTTASPVNITALYVFGDSIVDPGNINNKFLSISKANHPPYGNDFPGRIPTGRFSNGKLATDFYASRLGLKELLPGYLDPTLTDQDLLTGCSFATAGTGLDDLSSRQYNVPTLTDQVSYFEQALKRMERMIGTKEAGQIVENGVFLTVIGTNDMVKNVYMAPLRRIKYSVDEYHDLLLRNLVDVVKKLYNMGARKIAVAGLPPVGCLPMQITMESLMPNSNLLKRKCVNQQNIDSQSYNAKLQALIPKIQQTLPGSRIVYADIYNPMMDMITNPAAFGFEVTDKGCCGTGLEEFGYLCNPLNPVCPDVSKYLFWDGDHPTQIAYFYLQKFLPDFVA